MARMTACEKILARTSGRRSVGPGDVIDARPDVAMSHENSFLVHSQFKEMGAKRIANPSAVVIALDHRTPANTVDSANAHCAIREFVKELGIKRFFDAGQGICHQLLVEERLAKPGLLMVGSDSHSTTYGAVGAMGVGIGATDMACVWTKGTLWLKVPESIRMEIGGKPRKGVYAKDVSLSYISKLGSMGADYRSLEFHGDYMDKRSLSERMTLCNMAAEAGAKCAIVPQRARPDAGAHYEDEIPIDVSKLEPLVAIPHSVDRSLPVTSLERTEVDQAFIGSCTNGRLDDLAIAASILRGMKVRKGTRLIVTPASTRVLQEAMKEGIIQVLASAGAVVTPPGCGPCMGAHCGVLADGEACISSSNRNFRGRMGSRKASVYLASPATVAASAVEGRIADPRRYLK